MLEQAAGREIEQFLKDSILRDIGATIDAAALTGAGTPGVPLGILSMNENSGNPPYDLNKLAPGTTNGSGGATWTSVLDQGYHVEALDVRDDGSMTYITSPRVKRVLSATPILPSFPKFVWGDDNLIAGVRAEQISNLSATNQIVFGRWSDFVICLWAMDVLSDPISYISQNQIRLVITCLANMAPLRGISFSRSEDSAAGP